MEGKANGRETRQASFEASRGGSTLDCRSAVHINELLNCGDLSVRILSNLPTKFMWARQPPLPESIKAKLTKKSTAASNAFVSPWSTSASPSKIWRSITACTDLIALCRAHKASTRTSAPSRGVLFHRIMFEKCRAEAATRISRRKGYFWDIGTSSLNGLAPLRGESYMTRSWQKRTASRQH